MSYERVTAGEVKLGDVIARTRTAEFHKVSRIEEGPVAVRLFLIKPEFDAGTVLPDRRDHLNIRPRKTAKLWRRTKNDA